MVIAPLIDDDRRDAHIQGIRDFYELAAAEPRVSMTAIQTVGIKGYASKGAPCRQWD